jgi:hypothetical protein
MCSSVPISSLTDKPAGLPPTSIATTSASLSTLMSVISRDWARARGWAGSNSPTNISNLASDDHNISIPQEGALTTTVGRRVTIPFTGFVPIRNSQIKIKSQFALMPYVGRSFGNLYIYAGGGLALFDTSAKIVDATGFAVIGGATANMTGAPASFSSSD